MPSSLTCPRLSTFIPFQKTKILIFTWRGILSKLMTMQYDTEPITLIVSMDQTEQLIFIVEKKTKDVNMEDDKLLRAVYGGKKFETICTLELEEYEALKYLKNENNFLKMRLEDIVDPISEFGTVITRELGDDIVLFFGAELDCVWPETIQNIIDELNPGNLYLDKFIELKTINKQILQSEHFYRYK